MRDKDFYKVYSEHLLKEYGEKVYKLPINIPTTCPNRDGCVGTGGCIFCGEEGAGFENLENTLSVKEQLLRNMEYIKKRYKAKKFIAYFQNFTNTYMEFDRFKSYISQSILEDIVEISISTRPDCINNEILEFLNEVKQINNINITIELGLQTVNYHSLKKINRGHTLGEFLDSVLRIKKFDFKICVHLILNLPWDNNSDVIENAKVLSSLSVDYIKLHSLYIVENTVLSKMYLDGEIKMISKEEYIDRVIIFLEYLDPKIVLQRLIGRAPEDRTLFVNWNTSWWKIKDDILNKMMELNTKQGSKFDYLNGKALKNK